MCGLCIMMMHLKMDGIDPGCQNGYHVILQMADLVMPFVEI